MTQNAILQVLTGCPENYPFKNECDMTIDYRPVFGLIIIIGIFTDIIILSLKLFLVVRFDEMKWMAFLISVQTNIYFGPNRISNIIRLRKI